MPIYAEYYNYSYIVIEETSLCMRIFMWEWKIFSNCQEKQQIESDNSNFVKKKKQMEGKIFRNLY